MDAFDVLGLDPAFDLDPKVLEQRYRDLQRALHPDRYAQAPASERRASLARAVSVNEAYRTLRDDLARAEVLFVRRGGSIAEDTKRTADPSLLLEIMELREELAATRASKDGVQRERLAAIVRDKQREASDALRALLSDGTTGTRAKLEEAGSALSRLRYYRRFLDEVAALEDEASL